jgi:hypothetical protein
VTPDISIQWLFDDKAGAVKAKMAFAFAWLWAFAQFGDRPILLGERRMPGKELDLRPLFVQFLQEVGTIDYAWSP